MADKITYYPQWTWPKWVVPYRLWRFVCVKIGYREVGGPLSVVKAFAQIWHPKSTPYNFSLPIILSVTHVNGASSSKPSTIFELLLRACNGSDRSSNKTQSPSEHCSCFHLEKKQCWQISLLSLFWILDHSSAKTTWQFPWLYTPGCPGRPVASSHYWNVSVFPPAHKHDQKQLRKAFVSSSERLRLYLFPKLVSMVGTCWYHCWTWMDLATLSSTALTKLDVLELDHATPAANALTFFADHCKVVIAPFWNPSKLMWVADKITYYLQWTWPKWVVPYR